jgi:PAS domain S-box-containing protein
MEHTSDRRILIIEDDSTDFRALREALRESVPERFVVRHASRLHQAREMLQREEFDIVLLDISLADIGGLDQLGSAVEHLAKLPVVVLGSQIDEEFGARAVRAGAQDYLVKRYLNPDELERAISHAIARHQFQSQAYLLERRYHALVEGSRELHAIADASGFLQYTNFELERPSGYTYGDTARQSWFSLLHRDDQSRARAVWAELLEIPGSSRDVEVRFGQGGGPWRDHAVTLTNALKQPAIEGVIIRSHDVTHERCQQRILAALAEISRALGSAGDLSAKLRASFAILAGILPLEAVSILEYQDELMDDTPVVVQRFAWSPDGGADRMASDQDVDPRITERVNELAVSEPAIASAEVAAQIFRDHVNAPDNPVLLIPFPLDAQGAGAAVVRASEGHVWSEEEMTALQAAFGDIGSAISRNDAAERSTSIESRFEDVVGIIRDGVIVFDQSGIVRYANQAVQTVTGMKPAGFLQAHRGLLNRGSVRNLEQVVERADGRQTTVTIDIMRFSGSPSGGVIYIRENTTVQRAVQLLQGNEARLRAIVATAFEAIITTDTSGVIESFNPAAEAMFGHAADEVIGQSVRVLFPEHALDGQVDGIDPAHSPELFRSDSPSREMMARRTDGSIFPIEISTREYVHRNERKYIGSVRDISARRAAEDRIAYQIHQLESLRRVDRVLGSSRDFQVILDVVLDQLVLQPDIDAAVFRFFNDVTQALELRGERGFE